MPGDGVGGNLGFLVAGYGLTWLALGWYAWRLARRSADAARALERVGETGAAVEDTRAGGGG